MASSTLRWPWEAGRPRRPARRSAAVGASQNFGVSKNKGMNGEDQAQLAFDTLMAEVRVELGPHATLNAIEAALVQRQPLLMRSIIQQLQQEAPPAEELFPPGSGMDP